MGEQGLTGAHMGVCFCLCECVCVCAYMHVCVCVYVGVCVMYEYICTYCLLGNIFMVDCNV